MGTESKYSKCVSPNTNIKQVDTHSPVRHSRKEQENETQRLRTVALADALALAPPTQGPGLLPEEGATTTGLGGGGGGLGLGGLGLGGGGTPGGMGLGGLGLGGGGPLGGLGLGGKGASGGLGLGGLGDVGDVGGGNEGTSGERTGLGGATVREIGVRGGGRDGDEGGEDAWVTGAELPPGRHWVASEVLTTEAMAWAMAVAPPKAVADATECKRGRL